MAFDIEAHIACLKAKGEWTECHENGHVVESPDRLVCNRCGEDFEAILKALQAEEAE